MPSLTCKDCPYWDDAPLRDSVKSIGYCRINAPRAGTSAERDFPVTWDNDWCRPGREAMQPSPWRQPMRLFRDGS